MCTLMKGKSNKNGCTKYICGVSCSHGTLTVTYFLRKEQWIETLFMDSTIEFFLFHQSFEKRKPMRDGE